MITNFKLYESLEEGNFCVCEEDFEQTGDKKLYEWIANNIGMILNNDTYHCWVAYDNIPEELNKYFTDNTLRGKYYSVRMFSHREIKYSTDNYEDAKIFIRSNKFGI